MKMPQERREGELIKPDQVLSLNKDYFVSIVWVLSETKKGVIHLLRRDTNINGPPNLKGPLQNQTKRTLCIKDGIMKDTNSRKK